MNVPVALASMSENAIWSGWPTIETINGDDRNDQRGFARVVDGRALMRPPDPPRTARMGETPDRLRSNDNLAYQPRMLQLGFRLAF
jgi:hypothetical protein